MFLLNNFGYTDALVVDECLEIILSTSSLIWPSNPTRALIYQKVFSPWMAALIVISSQEGKQAIKSKAVETKCYKEKYAVTMSWLMTMAEW